MTTARSMVGRELARLRSERGKTGLELSEELGCTQSYISKIESGKLKPSLEFVTKFSKRLRLNQMHSDRLLAMTNDFLITFSRWSAEKSGNLEAGQERVRKQEEGASKIHAFALTVIPGLLQTPRYAEAIFRSYLSLTGTELPSGEILKGVQARISRQKVLGNSKKQIIFILSELALSNPFPDPAVHDEQISRLEDVLSEGKIDLRIVAKGACLSPPPLSSFHIFDGSHVSLEGPVSEQRVWNPEEVRVYQELFKNLMVASLSGRSAIDVLRRNLVG